MAAYNHMLQIRNSIRRLMSLGFVPLPFLRMAGKTYREPPHQCKFRLLHWKICSCMHHCKFSLLHWKICSCIFGPTASAVRFNTDFCTFSISVETFRISLSCDFFCPWRKKNTTAKSNQEI